MRRHLRTNMPPRRSSMRAECNALQVRRQHVLHLRGPGQSGRRRAVWKVQPHRAAWCVLSAAAALPAVQLAILHTPLRTLLIGHRCCASTLCLWCRICMLSLRLELLNCHAESAGFNCVCCCLGYAVRGKVSCGCSSWQQLDVLCDTKTKDNVFVQLQVRLPPRLCHAMT